MRPPLPLLMCLAGCASPSTVEVFDLAFTPVVPDGQTPFDAGDVGLWVDEGSVRDASVLGPATAGGWALDEVPTLEGATVSLLVVDVGAPLDPLDATDLRSFGRAPPVDLAEGDLTLPLVVGALGASGRLGDLAEPVIASAAAVLPDGDVWLLGGASPGAAGVQSATWRLDRADDDLAFRRAASLDDDGRIGAERAGASASAVATDDGVRVLLAGGRREATVPVAPYDSAWLLDPDGGDASGPLTMPATPVRDGARTDHAAIVRDDGTVWLLGGLDNASAPVLDWVVFDPATGAFDAPGAADEAPVDVGSAGPAWADLGDELVVCGGGVSTGPTIAPTDGCVRLGSGGEVFSLGTLAEGLRDVGPTARMHASMAPAGRGRVLITGGLAEPLTAGDPTAVVATASAWLLDVRTRKWTALPDLATPRAGHASIVLADGRVVLFGGAQAAAGSPAAAAGDAVDCPEVFDPETDTITPLAPCDDAGAGWRPAVATGGAYGAFVLEGGTTDGGGTAWTLVATGPTDASP